MKPVIVYGTDVCPYCQLAKRLLSGKGIAVVELNINQDVALREEMAARSGRRTVPQIFIGELHVGGYDDLLALDRQGKLSPLLGV